MDASPLRSLALRWQALRNIGALLRMNWRANAGLISLVLGLRVMSALLPLALLWVAKLIVDRVVASGGRAASLDSNLWMLVGLEFGLAAATDVASRLIDLCEALLAGRFSNEVNVRLMAHAATIDLATFEESTFQDRLERARAQTGAGLGALNSLARTLQIAATVLALSSGLIWYSPTVFLLLIVAVAPSFFGDAHFAMTAYAFTRRWTPKRRQLDYYGSLCVSRDAAKEVKVFGLERWLIDQYRALAQRIYDETRRLAVRRATIGSCLSLIGTTGYYTAYTILLIRAVRGELTIGDLAFLGGAFARSRSGLQMLSSSVTAVADQAVGLNDLFDFFKVRPRVTEPASPIPAPRPIRQGFEFRNVSFRYPGSGRWVLRHLNFRLEPREHIALVGNNGAGKTTVVKLMARLYDPTDGAVLLDGVDLREYALADLRQLIGIIFQDFMRYDLSVRANIAAGRLECMGDTACLAEASRRSGIESTIGRLAGGFDQILGRRFSNSVDLSGGEWQKLALARAYMRDAQLLILDEPTAALDARSEDDVFRRCRELMRDRMTVVISHRLSTARLADRVLVLEDGRVREEGTHERLVKLCGRYAELFNLQAGRYHPVDW